MFNKAMLMAFAKKVEANESSLTFVASSSGSALNLFKDLSDSIHSPEFFTVFVNGEETDQVFTSLTYASGDEVKIVCSSENGFPRFSAKYISAISVLPYMSSSSGEPISSLGSTFSSSCQSLTSIPEGLFDNNPEVTDFNETFYYCTNLSPLPEGLFDKHTKVTSFKNTFGYCRFLTQIPEGLFDNNTAVTNFTYTFNGCNRLASIPEGLFDNNTNVTTFSHTFDGCSALTSIPEGLFDNNTAVTNFTYTFNGCTGLSGRIKIGSSIVNSVSDFCKNTGAMTVIVPAGSTTETTFRAYADTVDNLTVETFEP